MLTLLGLCAGMTGMRYALDARWELAVAFILIAACIDAMDGRLARLLKSTSNFGAQLDSLSDFMNFGVAPGFISYLWVTHDIKAVGWALALFFAICGAIRLARFNSELDEEKTPPWSDHYFVGIPAPAGALMALAPLMLTFVLADYPDLAPHMVLFQKPWFVCLWLAVVALMMVSRIPTFSFKKTVVKREYASLVLVAAGLLFILFISEPWLTLMSVGVLYTLSIPVSGMVFLKEQRKRGM